MSLAHPNPPRKRVLMSDTALRPNDSQLWALIEAGTFIDPPAESGPQAQGDLVFIPWGPGINDYALAEQEALAVPLTRAGVTLLSGRGGNSHDLFATEGTVAFHRYPDSDTSPSLGLLVVNEGAVATIDHVEHGRTAIAPGCYVVRRQQEGTEHQRRLIAD